MTPHRRHLIARARIELAKVIREETDPVVLALATAVEELIAAHEKADDDLGRAVDEMMRRLKGKR